MTVTKLDAIVEYFGFTQEEARAFLIDAGEDPDEVLDTEDPTTIVSLQGEALDKWREASYVKSFGLTKPQAINLGICVSCKKPIHDGRARDPGAIYSEAGKREYQISGVCETCFDTMFAEEEDDD